MRGLAIGLFIHADKVALPLARVAKLTPTFYGDKSRLIRKFAGTKAETLRREEKTVDLFLGYPVL